MFSCAPFCGADGGAEIMQIAPNEREKDNQPKDTEKNMGFIEAIPDDLPLFPAKDVVTEAELTPPVSQATEPAAAKALLPTETQYIFEVAVDKRDGGLGVDLSPHDGKTLLIGRIKPGPLEDWNTARGDQSCDRVCRGDRITGVNGVGGSSEDILIKMRADTSLNFTLRRLLDFTITVQRLETEKFGVSLVDTDSTSKVIRVLHGRLEDTNKRNGAEFELRPNDEVYEANGKQGLGKAIREVLTSATDVTLKIRRPRVSTAVVAGSGMEFEC